MYKILGKLWLIVVCLASIVSTRFDNTAAGIIAIISLLLLLVVDYKLIISVIIVSLFNDVLTLHIGSYSMTLSRVSIILLFIIIILSKCNTKIEKKQMVFGCLMFLSAIISFITGNSSNSYLISWIVTLLMYFTILLNMQLMTDSLDKYFEIACIGCFVYILGIAFLLLVMPIQPNIYISRFTAFDGVNHNVLGKTITLSSILIIALCRKTNTIINKIIAIIALIISIIAVYRTGSRTSFFSLVFGGLLIFVLSTEKRNALRNGLILFLVVSTIGFYGIQFLSETRFSVASIFADNASGRFTNYPVVLFNVFPKYLFSGVGIGGQYNAIYTAGFPDIGPTHNYLLSVIVELGIIIGPVFIAWTIRWIREALLIYKNNHHDFYLLVLIITLMVIGLGETVYSEKYMFLTAALIECQFRTI